jgi:DinB family protein
MNSPAEVSGKFRAGMRRLRAAIKAVPDDREVLVGHWSVREIAAHIATWDRELVRGLDELLAGRRPGLLDVDEDAFNERAVRAWMDAPLEAILAELEAAHESLIARLEALSDGWSRSGLADRWPDRTPITVASLFGYTYRGQTHYDGHAEEIEAWIDKRRDLR